MINYCLTRFSSGFAPVLEPSGYSPVRCPDTDSALPSRSPPSSRSLSATSSSSSSSVYASTWNLQFTSGYHPGSTPLHFHPELSHFAACWFTLRWIISAPSVLLIIKK
ncbi:uncharacterized protein [Nothobranchius furzeri]|uniref:uncharacterized protein isoform X3 n=1 Tax=Nothobranchius furzeri TaxID=105023 RepID=UPI003904A962